jgi:hypothetical protein
MSEQEEEEAGAVSFSDIFTKKNFVHKRQLNP